METKMLIYVRQIQKALLDIKPAIFEDICQDLLGLLGVLDADGVFNRVDVADIERFEFTNAAGKDITIKYFISNSKGKSEVMTWWIECKRYKNSINPNHVGANIFNILQTNPPPPHLLLFMVANDVTNTIKNGIKKIRNPKISYMSGSEIAEQLLNNTRILKEYFPKIYENLPSEYKDTNKGMDLRKITFRSYDELEQTAPIAKTMNGKLISLQVQVKNISSTEWTENNISIHLPDGMECLRISKESFSLQPMDEKTIEITVMNNSKNKASAKIFDLKQVDLGFRENVNHKYETSIIQYKTSVYLPFCGREYELKRLRDFFCKNKSGMIVIEGFSGEGKSRLIDELSPDLLRKNMLLISIYKHMISDTHSLLKAFLLNFISDYIYPGNDGVTRLSLSKFFHNIGIDDEEFIDFLMLENTDTIDSSNRFVDYLKKIVRSTKTTKSIFIVDDLHSVSFPCFNLLLLIINELEGDCFFILSYRINEIKKQLREQILNRTSELIFLNSIEQSHLAHALTEIAILDAPTVNDLVERSLGNPFCLVESLRLLEEKKILEFNSNGYLKEINKGAVIGYNWPEDSNVSKIKKSQEHTRNKFITQYAHELAIRRFQSILDHAETEFEKRTIDKIVHSIAAFGSPLPLSFFEKEYSEEVFKTLEILVSKKFLIVNNGEFVDEHGIYFIHDRMTEAIRRFGQQKVIKWSRINKDVADAAVKLFSKQIIELFFEQLANMYEIGGNLLEHVRYLILLFYKYKSLDYVKELVLIGERILCSLKKIDERKIDTDIANKLDYKKGTVLLNMGIALYAMRNFEQMESCFQQYLTEFPVSRIRNHIVNTYRLTADTWRQTTDYDNIYKSFVKSILFFDTIDAPSKEIIEAQLNAMIQCFLYYKNQKADYESGESYLNDAESLCNKHKMEKELTWIQNHRGTLLLFKTEKMRNQLEYCCLPKLLQLTLNHWSKVLNRAETFRFTEYIIELNSTVGFLKMLMGNFLKDKELMNESEQHLLRSRELSHKHDYFYWLSKLHNHFGILNALKGEFNISENEFNMGLILAKENNNKHTPWMMRQGLAYISEINGETENNILKHWEKAFKDAMGDYFQSPTAALRHYNFRQFYRGYLVHAVKYDEVAQVITMYPDLNKLVLEDEGFNLFKKVLIENGYDHFINKDIYTTQFGYFNTH